jgi:hypothetical protein
VGEYGDIISDSDSITDDGKRPYGDVPSDPGAGSNKRGRVDASEMLHWGMKESEGLSEGKVGSG